jgi:hypothetical protein
MLPSYQTAAPITSGGRFSPLGPRGILRSRYDVKSGGFKGSYDGKSHVSTVFFAPEDSITCDAVGSLGMNDIGRHDCRVDNVKNLRLVHGCLPWSVPRYHEKTRCSIKVKVRRFQTETPTTMADTPHDAARGELRTLRRPQHESGHRCLALRAA